MPQSLFAGIFTDFEETQSFNTFSTLKGKTHVGEKLAVAASPLDKDKCICLSKFIVHIGKKYRHEIFRQGLPRQQNCATRKLPSLRQKCSNMRINITETIMSMAHVFENELL